MIARWVIPADDAAATTEPAPRVAAAPVIALIAAAQVAWFGLLAFGVYALAS